MSFGQVLLIAKDNLVKAYPWYQICTLNHLCEALGVDVSHKTSILLNFKMREGKRMFGHIEFFDRLWIIYSWTAVFVYRLSLFLVSACINHE